MSKFVNTRISVRGGLTACILAFPVQASIVHNENEKILNDDCIKQGILQYAKRNTKPETSKCSIKRIADATLEASKPCPHVNKTNIKAVHISGSRFWSSIIGDLSKRLEASLQALLRHLRLRTQATLVPIARRSNVGTMPRVLPPTTTTATAVTLDRTEVRRRIFRHILRGLASPKVRRATAGADNAAGYAPFLLEPVRMELVGNGLVAERVCREIGTVEGVVTTATCQLAERMVALLNFQSVSMPATTAPPGSVGAIMHTDSTKLRLIDRENLAAPADVVTGLWGYQWHV
ncbi:hypothetical protein DPSP01_002283 [Paraphaeosphaeria sporulosa]